MAAVGLGLAAALGFGSAAIFARVAMQRASPLAVIFVSLVSSFAVSAALALAFAFSDLITLPPVVLAWCLLLGVMNFVGGRNLSYMSINRIGASRAAAIVSTSTVFAAILAITLTGERPHVLVVAGTVVVVGGLAVAMGRGILEGHTAGRTALTGYLLAFAAAACYGGTNVVAKELTHQLTSPLVISSISLFFGMLLLLPVAGRPAMARLRQPGASLSFAGFAVLSGIVAAMAVNCLYFALQKSEVVVISPIVSANPLVTLMLAWLFLSQLENVNRWLFLGTGIVATGVVLVVLGSQL